MTHSYAIWDLFERLLQNQQTFQCSVLKKLGGSFSNDVCMCTVWFVQAPASEYIISFYEASVCSFHECIDVSTYLHGRINLFMLESLIKIPLYTMYIYICISLTYSCIPSFIMHVQLNSIFVTCIYMCIPIIYGDQTCVHIKIHLYTR